MAVGYGTSTSTGVNDSLVSSVNVPVPSGVVSGNHVYVALEMWEVGNPAVTTPTGFELVGQAVSGSQKLKVFCKQATGSDTGNYTFSWTGSQWTIGHAVRVTGGKAVNNPTATAFNTATAASGTAIPNTSVTVGYIPGLLHFVANENSALQTTPPTNFTEVQDSNYLHSNHRMNAVASGTFTAPSGTLAASTLSLAFLVAIEPAGGGGTPINVTLNRAAETNSANALSRAKAIPLQRSTETGTSRQLLASKAVTLNRTTETELARQLTKSGLWVLGRAEETESAKSLGVARGVVFSRAIENDVARTISSTTFQTVVLGRATETDTARNLSSVRGVTLGRAIETSSGRALLVAHRAVLPRVSESSLAQTLGVSRAVLLPRAVESNVALGVTLSGVVHLLRAVETDVARELTLPDTAMPFVDDGTGALLANVDHGQVVNLVKATSGLLVVTIVADLGERP